MWVEVTFKPTDRNPYKSHIHLEHHGIGHGETWDHVYEFFYRNWTQILFRLDSYVSLK